MAVLRVRCMIFDKTCHFFRISGSKMVKTLTFSFALLFFLDFAFLYWRKNQKFFPISREESIQIFFTLCFFIEGKLSVICCVIIIQREESISRYIRRFFIEGILDCDRYPIENISSLTLLLFLLYFFIEGKSVWFMKRYLTVLSTVIERKSCEISCVIIVR